MKNHPPALRRRVRFVLFSILCLLAHVHLSSDLGGEVVLFLLDALAGLEADEALDVMLPPSSWHFGHVLFHGDLVAP